MNVMLLGAYGLGSFSLAYMLPTGWYTIRLLFGYMAITILGLTVLGLIFPKVAEASVWVLNGGMGIVWNFM